MKEGFTMRKLSTFLIIFGILIIAYPLLDRTYSWYMQMRIEQTYSDLGEVFTSSENTGISVENPGTPTASTDLPASPAIPADAVIEQPAPPEPAPVPVDESKPVGEILIPKIKVKLPVMYGATQANMKVGAGWMKETTPIGQGGNTAIAAHRSYTRGRFFNRLNEVALGDEITIIADGKEYKYSVYNIVVVEPTDVSVLRGKRSEQVITLITCTPIRVATHRLIVQARRTN